MKKDKENAPALIVLVITSEKTRHHRVELGTYIVNCCHQQAPRREVSSFTTGFASHFLYHLPFCYRLN